MAIQRKKLATISCGLGHVNRGFEVSASRWYQTLKNDPDLEVKLYSGDHFKDAIAVFNMPRDSKISNFLRKISLIKDGCRLEQISFALGYANHLLLWKPDFVWTQEYSFAEKLLKIKEYLNLDFKIVFVNGAPIGPDLYYKFDIINHLTPLSYDEGIKYGILSSQG